MILIVFHVWVSIAQIEEKESVMKCSTLLGQESRALAASCLSLPSPQTHAGLLFIAYLLIFSSFQPTSVYSSTPVPPPGLFMLLLLYPPARGGQVGGARTVDGPYSFHPLNSHILLLFNLMT